MLFRLGSIIWIIFLIITFLFFPKLNSPSYFVFLKNMDGKNLTIDFNGQLLPEKLFSVLERTGWKNHQSENKNKPDMYIIVRQKNRVWITHFKIKFNKSFYEISIEDRNQEEAIRTVVSLTEMDLSQSIPFLTKVKFFLL